MVRQFSEIAFTPAVKKLQEEMGSRQAYARMETPSGPPEKYLTANEAEFIAARDSFYMASVGETGWPYIQHRGGPAGFVRMLDETTLGFADFRGNRQYVSVGNLAGSDKVSLFFMDYPNQARLKIFGRARVAGLDEAGLMERLSLPHYRARPERAIIIKIEAFDWNCPQHITQRYTLDEMAPAIDRLKDRIAELEAQLAPRDQNG